ncbi:MAG: carboxypeptidase regulatory-like domain-containing protein [Phycisphaerae bacterium]
MKHHLSIISGPNFLKMLLATLVVLNVVKGKLLDNSHTALIKPAVAKSVFTGTVTDALGNPIEGAVVKWSINEASTTDSDGQYRLEVNLLQKMTLYVYCEGYAPAWKGLLAPGTQAKPEEVSFALEQGHWLIVTVVNKDGQPIPLVNIMPHFNQTLEVSRLPGHKPLQTDEQGCVLLEDLPAPKVKLDLTGDELTFKHITAEVDQEITVIMDSAMIIRGRVLDKEYGSSINNFKIWLHGMEVPEELRNGRWFSDTQGRFTLTDLQIPMSIDIAIKAEGYPVLYAGEVMPQSPAKAKENVYYLPFGQIIKGTLLDETTGKPLPDVPITYAFFRYGPYGSPFAETQIITDENGEFIIVEEKKQWPKDYIYSDEAYTKIHTLFIRHKGYEKLTIGPSDRARYRTETGDLRIALAPGASISGVYSIDGRPQPKVNIMARYGDQNFGRVVTDAKGRFHWDDLSAGTYILQGPFEYRVTLKKGEHKSINFGEDMGDCTLFGRAFKEGKPIACDTVTLHPVFEWQFRQFSCQTDNEGRYHFEGLRPGKYEAYPGGRITGPFPNDYGPEIIEIHSNSDTEWDFDFQKRR